MKIKKEDNKVWAKLAVQTGIAQLGFLLLATVMLSACGLTQERLSQIGKEPELSAIENPQENPNYKPVSLPMPEITARESQPNSLWQSGRNAFFKDQRASQVGDILSVIIDIKDQADLENKSSRTRKNSENAAVPNILGFESKLGKLLPDAVDPTSLVDATSATSNAGTGKIERDEEIKTKIAAMVTQKLPNGNFVIMGRQEVRVNFEVRELLITGVIRPEDIATNNTISYEKIAEARIAYGGRGQITDFQQPRYGQQFFDVVFPF